MTNVYFFATKEDLPPILDFLIGQGCQIFDTQSEINVIAPEIQAG